MQRGSRTQNRLCLRCGKADKAVAKATITGWLFNDDVCQCGPRARIAALDTGQPSQLSRTITQLRWNVSSPVRETVDDPSMFGQDYEVLGLLGQGGMGAVYRVRNKSMDSEFAIKVLSTDFARDALAAQRFETESRAVSALTHRNLVSVLGQGRSPDGAPYMVMDLVHGQNLGRILESYGKLEMGLSLDIFVQICEALEYAHRNRIIHRDLKPSNIMITLDEKGRGLVKVVDFGIARIAPEGGPILGTIAQTGAGGVLGSPSYMSPEQCRGEQVDERSDIYSFGCVMYECLTGTPCFQDDNPIKIILKQLSQDAPSIVEKFPELKISEGLDGVIMRCLEKDRTKRYQDMKELRRDLERISNGQAVMIYRRKAPRLTHPLDTDSTYFMLYLIALAGYGVVCAERHSLLGEPQMLWLSTMLAVVLGQFMLRVLYRPQGTARMSGRVLRLSIGFGSLSILAVITLINAVQAQRELPLYSPIELFPVVVTPVAQAALVVVPLIAGLTYLLYCTRHLLSDGQSKTALLAVCGAILALALGLSLHSSIVDAFSMAVLFTAMGTPVTLPSCIERSKTRSMQVVIALVGFACAVGCLGGHTELSRAFAIGTLAALCIDASRLRNL